MVEKEDSHLNKLDSEIKVNNSVNKYAPVTTSKKDKSDESDRHDESGISWGDPSISSRQINWKDYPYNSSNERTKKERGNKVKERILGCSTSNELIKLHNEAKISDQAEPASQAGREIDWLKVNLLKPAEIEQFKAIEVTRQGNLFNEADCGEIVREETVQEQFDFDDVMKAIDEEMRRLNWSRGDGKDYLIKTYGVKSRHKLNDVQLIEFWNYLKKR